MQMYSKEGFRRIYLLTGTAPEIYGTGHARRMPVLRQILPGCNLSIHPVMSPPREFWKHSDGQSLLKTIEQSASGPGEELVIVDARDLDPSPLLPYVSVLALDNQSELRKDPKVHYKNRTRTRLPLLCAAHPCLFYDTLLHEGLSLEGSVRRYLGPSVQEGTVEEVRFDLQDRPSVSGSGPAMVFYAGPPGFLSDTLVHSLDEYLSEAFGGQYIRVGGSDAPSLPSAEFQTLLNHSRFFLGYYGLSLYRAAASGCKTWGLLCGHPYHDDLILQWSSQSGGPLLGQGLAPESRGEVGVFLAPDGENRSDSVKRIQKMASSDLGWTVPAGSLQRGRANFLGALRALRRIRGLQSRFELSK